MGACRKKCEGGFHPVTRLQRRAAGQWFLGLDSVCFAGPIDRKESVLSNNSDVA